MTEHGVDFGRRQFWSFIKAPCQGCQERAHDELQHKLARDRTIVFKRRQFLLYQLGKNAADFVNGDNAALMCVPKTLSELMT